jgi:hypothetical protein
MNSPDQSSYYRQLPSTITGEPALAQLLPEQRIIKGSIVRQILRSPGLVTFQTTRVRYGRVKDPILSDEKLEFKYLNRDCVPNVAECTTHENKLEKSAELVTFEIEGWTLLGDEPAHASKLVNLVEARLGKIGLTIIHSNGILEYDSAKLANPAEPIEP